MEFGGRAGGGSATGLGRGIGGRWVIVGEGGHDGPRLLVQAADGHRQVAQLDDVTVINTSVTLELGAWRLRGGVNNVTDEQYRK